MPSGLGFSVSMPRRVVSPASTADSSVPHTGMRRAIAQRLSQSKQTIPHFYLTIDCDVGALLALRDALEAQAGFKPSLNDFLVKAVADHHFMTGSAPTLKLVGLLLAARL